MHVKRMLFLFDFMKPGGFRQIFKNTQISNFMKIRPVGAEFLHADIQTDRHDEANSRYSKFCERV